MIQQNLWQMFEDVSFHCSLKIRHEKFQWNSTKKTGIRSVVTSITGIGSISFLICDKFKARGNFKSLRCCLEICSNFLLTFFWITGKNLMKYSLSKLCLAAVVTASLCTKMKSLQRISRNLWSLLVSQHPWKISEWEFYGWANQSWMNHRSFQQNRDGYGSF